MMKKLVALALVVMLAAALLPITGMADGGRTMYVYTENGKSLNVRSQPATGNNIIAQIAYGTSVNVLLTSANGWAAIEWKNGAGGVAYVQSRFLVSTKPASKSGSTTPADTTTNAAKVLSDMNAEFRTAKKVDLAYYVVARPSRASGWVNLRWAPSTEAERIATCPQGKELIVLVEMKNWYQVEDPVTGMIGFISNKYVVKQ